MSAPTRGMVAGQPIKTTAQTREFDEGFDRTFGERKPHRGRFRYDPERKECVPLDADWDDAPRSTGDLGKFQYDNLRATDGTDISSRTKRREYMKANGYADPTDFAPDHAEKVRAQREREQDKQTREVIEREFWKQTGY
jgi:hypothetical protein